MLIVLLYKPTLDNFLSYVILCYERLHDCGGGGGGGAPPPPPPPPGCRVGHVPYPVNSLGTAAAGLLYVTDHPPTQPSPVPAYCLSVYVSGITFPTPSLWQSVVIHDRGFLDILADYLWRHDITPRLPDLLIEMARFTTRPLHSWHNTWLYF